MTGKKVRKENDMATITLNDELKMSCPDSFHVMGVDEIKDLQFLNGEGPMISLSDPDRHVVLTVGWKMAPGLANLLLNSKDIAQSSEAQIRKGMEPFGYVKESFAKRKIGSEDGCGFRYRYSAQDTEMSGEFWTMKHRKVVYYFNVYTRTEGREENLKVWEEILDSVV